ncbi:sialate O-acetylesterase [Planctomycetes bacterium K23_9]|uniref:Sialate O-acetylesterase domain-containing protein n=1 Tax=Stieleria marina TaxID=1930275 RepID=A0A517P2Z6_9BACT|nr:hypothetical protein K239x_57690 [Planctomycetes bacterium K23_9]
MRGFFLIALLATTFPRLLFAAEANAAEPIDMFIVAGQSNAVGVDAPASELTKQPIDDSILIWWRTGDPPPDKHDSISDGWQTLRAQPKGDPILPRDNKTRQWGNYAQADGGFGPEIGFARTVAAKRPTPVAIIKVAFSGTHVEGDWDPQAEPTNEFDWRDSQGACYRQLIDEYGRAIEGLQSRGFTPTARAMIWVQGESDANSTMAPRYEANLREMVGALRSDIATPGMMLVLGVNTEFSRGKNKFVPKIVASQKKLATQEESIIYVDTEGATTFNAAHFDAAGTIDVGERFAKAWLSSQ